METVAPSALIVGILYFLSRWALATVDYAAAHPGKGRPDITWRMAWWLAILISLASAASAHIFILTNTRPTGAQMLFNGIMFGAFLVGFVVSGQLDHKLRLGLGGK
jgi:hypothetical protein